MPLIFLLVFLFSIAIAPAAYAANGDFGNSDYTDIGEDSNPYLIDDKADLKAFRDIVNGDHGTIAKNTEAHAKLTADINLNNESWTPIGNPTTAYTGTFDGGGYAIDGLSVTEDSYTGFFGNVGRGGVVKNLTIASGSVNGAQHTGGIVGYNNGTVQNCTNSGTVAYGSYVGGIVGYNTGTVQNCTNSGTVDNFNGGGSYNGGIVGYNSGTVQNCGYLKNDNVNQNINPIGYGSGTNVSSFTSDAMDQIAVTLFASIADSAIEPGGETTITLTTRPGTASNVMEAEGLAISASDSNGLVTFTNNNDGTLTVTGKGNSGEAVITVTAKLYTYKYSDASGGYDTGSASTYKYTFALTLTGAGETPGTADPEANPSTDPEETPGTATDSEENPGAKSLGSSGCNAGTGALALLALIPLALRRKR